MRNILRERMIVVATRNKPLQDIVYVISGEFLLTTLAFSFFFMNIDRIMQKCVAQTGGWPSGDNGCIPCEQVLVFENWESTRVLR
jgi:hypothetical protein